MSKLSDLLARWFRHAQRLFHVLVGLVFLCLALAGAAVSFQQWQDYQKQIPSVGVVGVSLLAGFTVLLLIFCLYSFVKARSVR